MDDYLEAGSLILSRLREKMPEINLMRSNGKPAFQESPDLPPAVILLLEEDRPGEETGNGASQRIEQVWLCLAVTRDEDGEAGFFISRIIKALSGWRPLGGRFSPLKRVRSSFAPESSPGGLHYFPVAFQTGFVFNID
jgi:hypothetical protein